MVMTCQSVHVQMSSLLDRMLTGAERRDVLAHIESCRLCNARFEAMRNLRAELRKMDRAALPGGLIVQLRVLASHERVRHLSRVSWSARLAYWRDRIRFEFDNLMRPVALPFAGGVLSALILFGMLVPTLSFRHNVSDDLQLSIVSDPDGRVVGWTGDFPRLEPMNTVGSSDEAVVELTIDEQGRVADYSVSQGQLTPEMQSIILFSRFTPATFFGRSTWGKKLVFFRRHRSVRG